jgi:hypothetical protein
MDRDDKALLKVSAKVGDLTKCLKDSRKVTYILVIEARKTAASSA